MSIFLTGTDIRHSILHKQKHFRDKTQTKLTSNSSKLTGASREAPIDVDNAFFQGVGDAADDDVAVLREEDEDQQDLSLDGIPDIHEAEDQVPSDRRPKRRRQISSGAAGQAALSDRGSGGDGNDNAEVIDSDSDDGLFVGAESDSDEVGTGPPHPKRRKEKDVEQTDDKKKLAMDISYEGFAIYGRVLCLVIKRRDGALRGSNLSTPSGSKSQTGRPGGQAMMENWITSTQLPEPGGAEDDAV